MRGGTRVLVAFGLLVGASTCALIAGVEDGVLAPPESSTGGAAGTGGTGASGGAGGMGASGGGGGAAGMAPTYAEVVLSDDPVAYWRLDDRDPMMALDSGPNGYHGVYSGNLLLGEAGAIVEPDSRAVFFNGGSNDYVAISDVLDFTGDVPMTVEAWVKQTEMDGTIVAKTFYDGANYHGWMLMMLGYRACMLRDIQLCSSADVAVDAWTHVVGRFDGGPTGSLRIYVNGVEMGVGAPTTPLEDTPEPIEIGVATWGAFDGWIDEVAIYDMALPVGRIEAHYEAGVGR